MNQSRLKLTRCAILVGFAADSQINAAQWRLVAETRLVVSGVVGSIEVVVGWTELEID